MHRFWTRSQRRKNAWGEMNKGEDKRCTRKANKNDTGLRQKVKEEGPLISQFSFLAKKEFAGWLPPFQRFQINNSPKKLTKGYTYILLAKLGMHERQFGITQYVKRLGFENQNKSRGSHWDHLKKYLKICSSPTTILVTFWRLFWDYFGMLQLFWIELQLFWILNFPTISKRRL